MIGKDEFLELLRTLPPTYMPTVTNHRRTIYLKVNGRLMDPLLAVLAVKKNEHDRILYNDSHWPRIATELGIMQTDAKFILDASHHPSTIKEIREFRREILKVLNLPPDPRRYERH